VFVLSFFGQRALGVKTEKEINRALREIADKLEIPFPSDQPAG
jgi:hypothetical protein